MSQYRIEEYPGPGRLGRHVNHDPESTRYRVEQAGAPQSQRWVRSTPILDQGELGSCTGNASAGVLGTAPFTGTEGAGFTGDEQDAIKIYSLATRLDSVGGTYPPTDSGSDGLSAAKACKQLGWISGYTHALSMDDLLGGLQSGPCIVGVNWYDSFDTPDADGKVTLPKGAKVRGGHEIECNQVDMAAELLWLPNSWGASWGKGGYFGLPFTVVERLLSEDGDATFFTSVDKPAPVPTPVPGGDADAALAAALTVWEPTIFSRITKAGRVKTAGDAWMQAHGYKENK